MQYIDEFIFASERDESGFILSYGPKMTMLCYSQDNIYPFKIFPPKKLDRLEFKPVTILCGGNGSGKTTALNIIAEKLRLRRSAPFNNTPFFSEYLKMCKCRLTFGRNAPAESRIITSDDVFDFLLDARAINEGIESRREDLFAEYDTYTDPNRPSFVMKSLDDYEELKRRNEARFGTKSQYVTRRIPKELNGKSNGESAFSYFTHEIKDNALYLLDEPENSLSASLQRELAQFITDSVRFYNCQFIISSHSPFILSLKGARIYDLDVNPVVQTKWIDIANVRIYREFFKEHEKEFYDEENG